MVEYLQADAKRSGSERAPSLYSRVAGSTIRLVLALLIVFGLLTQTGAEAEVPISYAGIVIRPGDGTVTYAYVPIDETVSGIELLRRSGVSLVTVGFGGLGEGVCQIERTGCEVGPCRTRLCQTGDRDSPYWRYFQSSEDGEWVASPLGGSGSKVSPGDVDGWSWTPDEAKLPIIAITDIPQLAGVTDEPGTAHFARYDASGNLLDIPTARDLQERSYVAVLGMLIAVAVFGIVLRLRTRSEA